MLLEIRVLLGEQRRFTWVFCVHFNKTKYMDTRNIDKSNSDIFIKAFELWIAQEGEKYQNGVFATSDSKGNTLKEILEQMKNNTGWGADFLFISKTKFLANENFLRMNSKQKEKATYVYFQSKMREFLFFPNAKK